MSGAPRVSEHGSAPTGDPQADGEPQPTDPEPKPQPQPPFLRVITPDATPEEVAALVAVFAALGGGEEQAPRRRPEWNAPHRMVRPSFAQGPGGWRSSGLPR